MVVTPIDAAGKVLDSSVCLILLFHSFIERSQRQQSTLARIAIQVREQHTDNNTQTTTHRDIYICTKEIDC